ncbi:MAG: hypothetical protein ABH846_04020 [Patescibacteria group bacterium]
MKKFAVFAAVVLLGAGCMGGAAPDTSTVQGTWDAIESAIKAGDCEAFATYFTDRLSVGEEQCQEAIEVYEEHGGPAIDWEKTNEGAGDTTTKVYMEGERTLTTFVKDSDGMWKADTIFWR